MKKTKGHDCTLKASLEWTKVRKEADEDKKVKNIAGAYCFQGLFSWKVK